MTDTEQAAVDYLADALSGASAVQALTGSGKRKGWEVYTYYDVRWERGSAYGNPRGDVITSPVGSRVKTVERRRAIYGESLAVEIWNPGQISESCARFAIVYPREGQVYQTPADPNDDSYDAIFDRHNSLFDADGRFLPECLSPTERRDAVWQGWRQ